MTVLTLLERVAFVAEGVDIILDRKQGLIDLSPSVKMFYGIHRDKLFLKSGISRERRYLALIGNTIIIETYENQITV